jgi:hypothetical protein
MSFHHVRVEGKPPVIASFCVKCWWFIAASGNLQTLAMAEKLHRCPQERRSNQRTSATR